MFSYKPDFSKLILRLGIGGLMIFHGIHKLLHGHDFIQSSLHNKGLPEFLWVGVPISEVIAPIAIILGLFTRIASLLIVLVMLFSLFLAFGAETFTLTPHGGLKGELNLFYIFAGTALFFAGSGKYSVYRGNNIWLQ